MFYRCGSAHRLDPETLEDLGSEQWHGRFPSRGISAHAKVDESTGELLFFNYSAKKPYLTYGVVSPHNKVIHHTPIPIDAPKLQHDMCFTANYSILGDLATQLDETQLMKGKFKNCISQKPCRFAVVPRYGDASDVMFFEVRRTYVLHFLNAFEEVDKDTGHKCICMDGYRQCMYDAKGEGGNDGHFVDDQAWKSEVPASYHRIFPTFGGMNVLVPRLWRWRFDLETGLSSEGPLKTGNDCLTEFGVFNQTFAGRPYRFAYSCVLKPAWLLFTGLIKHDFEQGTSTAFHFGEGTYCSEPAFAPRLNPKSEDDGYLITFTTCVERDRSECVILDALDIEAGPVCRLRLPHRISSGTHACWTPLGLLGRKGNDTSAAPRSKL